MKNYCVICAHPDDETLFFSSILDSFNRNCSVQCLTDGNADGRGKERKKEFEAAINHFGVTDYTWTGLKDDYNSPLDKQLLERSITETILSLPEDALIFTHGPFGDYGHPHHIQVSHAVHKVAYHKGYKVYTPNTLNLKDDKKLFESPTSASSWKKKLEVMESIYILEYQRFVTLIPARANETFLQSDSTTLTILEFLSHDNTSEEIKGDLGVLGPYRKSLEIFKKFGLTRKF